MSTWNMHDANAYVNVEIMTFRNTTLIRYDQIFLLSFDICERCIWILLMPLFDVFSHDAIGSVAGHSFAEDDIVISNHDFDWSRRIHEMVNVI